MKNITKIVAGILAVLAAASPLIGPYAANLAVHHPILASLGAIASVLGALFHNPQSA